MNKLIQFLKEFPFAYTIGGKIYGCEEYSLCWWHEMGHIIRFNNKIHLSICGYVCLLGAPALFLSRTHVILFNSIGVVWAFVILFYEIDAWIYAIKHYHERELGNNQP